MQESIKHENVGIEQTINDGDLEIKINKIQSKLLVKKRSLSSQFQKRIRHNETLKRNRTREISSQLVRLLSRMSNKLETKISHPL